MSIQAKAYVKDGRLIVIGLAQLKIGPVPFTYDCVVPEGTPDGPFDMNAETGNEALEACLAEAEAAIMKRIKRGALRVGAENLVLRARQGDQNAMAMLTGIRKNAAAGVPRARAALLAVKQYIEDHPPTESCQFGHEVKLNVSNALAKHVESNNPTHYVFAVLQLVPHVDTERAVVLVANGPLLDNGLIDRIQQNFDERETIHFAKGLSGQLNSSKACQLGNTVRLARELQAARRGMFQLCSPVVRYELGE